MFLNGFDMDDTYYSGDYLYEPRCVTRDYVELILTGILHETDKAYLLRRSNGSFWVPKAMCGRVREDRAEISGSFKINYIKKSLRGNK